jgi:N6-L-threonylcarbamoyladenine synthase
MDYPVILAIETSCDETSAAVVSNGKILANVVATQEIHARYGGVIPELASRSHDLVITSVVKEALNMSNTSLQELNAVAVTQGPGLLGALLVGNSFAKGLSWSLKIPLIGVNHLHAHIAALFIENKKVEFPILCLLVSGGHTQLIRVENERKFEILGQTIDDAAGEAFDKIAKLLGLPYPGGPQLDKLAQKGNPHRFSFPKPNVANLNFSFSGLKTSVLYFVQKQQNVNPAFIAENLADLCASVQYTINSYLLSQTKKALKLSDCKSLGIVGGVSANSGLRKDAEMLCQQKGIRLLIPQLQYCTDNAAMIAMSAHFAFLQNDFMELDSVPYTRSK